MSIELSELKLTQELAKNWFLAKAGEKASTRGSRISALWGFAKYLSSIGTEVTWRPIPGYTGRQKRYVPYIYTTDEIKIYSELPIQCRKHGANHGLMLFFLQCLGFSTVVDCESQRL